MPPSGAMVERSTGWRLQVHDGDTILVLFLTLDPALRLMFSKSGSEPAEPEFERKRDRRELNVRSGSRRVPEGSSSRSPWAEMTERVRTRPNASDVS